jgi:hypothetical protein
VIDRRISAISTTGRVKEGKNRDGEKDKGEQTASSMSLSAMEPGPDEVLYTNGLAVHVYGLADTLSPVPAQDKCVYCGLGELELCSPFVVGQSRAEHEAVLQLAQQKPTADGFYPGATGTTVVFLNQVSLLGFGCV